MDDYIPNLWCLLFILFQLYILIPIITFCTTKKKEYVCAIDKSAGVAYIRQGSDDDIQVIKLSDLEKSSPRSREATITALVAKQKGMRSSRESHIELKQVRSNRSRKSQKSDKTQDSESSPEFMRKGKKNTQVVERVGSKKSRKSMGKKDEKDDADEKQKKSRRSQKKEEISLGRKGSKVKSERRKSEDKKRSRRKDADSQRSLSKKPSKKDGDAKKDTGNKQNNKYDTTQKKSVGQMKVIALDKKPETEEPKGGDINQMFKNLAKDPRIMSILSQVPSTASTSRHEVKDEFGTAEEPGGIVEPKSSQKKQLGQTDEHKSKRESRENLVNNPTKSATSLKIEALPKSNISE